MCCDTLQGTRNAQNTQKAKILKIAYIVQSALYCGDRLEKRRLATLTYADIYKKYYDVRENRGR